jgi:uncharacterized membrane protein
MLLPALVSRARRWGTSRVGSLLAAMEMVADKIPWTPSRTSPLSLAGRMVLGAAVAFGTASSSRRWRSRPRLRARVGLALVGASAAAASAFLMRAVRARVSDRGGTANVVGGVVEDLVAFGAGRALTGA